MNNQSLFPGEKEYFWRNVVKHLDQITEIRIRTQKPVVIYMNQKELSLNEKGEFLYSIENGYQFDYKELQKLIDFYY